jgi:hypothetical protein
MARGEVLSIGSQRNVLACPIFVPVAVRDYACHYATQAITYRDVWDRPGFDIATDWVEIELANLRAGFRWATDRSDLTTATAIAAHTAMLAPTTPPST